MIPYATLEGAAVLEAAIGLPRLGNWHADVAVDATDAASFTPGTPVTLSVRGLDFIGTTRRADVARGAAHVRVVGGAGGFSTRLPAQGYADVPVATVVGDILRGSGERLCVLSDVVALGAVLGSWTRPAGPAAHALDAVVDAAGATWRILRDGSVWIGTDAWPAFDQQDFTLLRWAPELARAEVLVDPPAIVPGVSFRGSHVSYVEHRISPTRTITTLLFEADGADGDRPKDAFAKLLESHLGRKIDFTRTWPSRVIAQSLLDGTLELFPLDDTMPQMVGVPIAYGVPGVKAVVAPGAIVHLAFAGGDPGQPRATVWDSADVLELDLKATLLTLNGGNHPIARVGDPVVGTAGPFPVAAVIGPPGNPTVLG